MPHIFRVAELTRALKEVVEGQFPFVWVRGQVSNLARPGSGHVYFSLKDDESVLNVVWFKGSQAALSLGNGEKYDPLTGEVLEHGGGAEWLKDGAEVLCAGRLTVYAPRGVYQLVAELVQDQGLGKLYLEFEALKAKMAAKGYFALERKRVLPHSPVRVAVITAPGGAAIRDFLRVGRERGLGCEARLYPVLVQGESAPGQIVAALKAAGEASWAQVVVVIRGGGSIEDLWAFNTEGVAEAIFNCPIPVICGVGHEVDTTIADLVADVRAATPSHVAQILWPERAVLAQRLDEAELALRAAFGRYFQARHDGHAALGKALAWLSPKGQVRRLEERLDDLALRLDSAAERSLERRARDCDDLIRRLGVFGPGVLAGLEQERSGLDRRLAAFGPGWLARKELVLDDLARRVGAFGPGWLAGRERDADALNLRLDAAGQRLLARREADLTVLATRLDGLDPEKPLERGYALVRKANGKFLRRVADVSPGDGLDIIIRDGTVHTAVTSVEARPE